MKIIKGFIIGLLVAIPLIVTSIELQFIPHGTDMSAVRILDNSGNVVDFPVIMTFTATTNSSGVATVWLTDDYTSEGGPMTSEVYSIIASPRNNTASISAVPLACTKLLTGNTLTINVIESNAIIATGEGLEFSPANVVVDITVIGKLYGY